LLSRDILRSLVIIAGPSNTGEVYIGNSALNTTTLVGLIGLVSSGNQWSVSGQRDEVTSLRSLWVQGNSGDLIAVAGEVL
jgi:hypothetical protein